jgi:3-oxoacyl-[acyl-carrier protein] reductase
MVSLNLSAPYRCTQLALAMMRRHRYGRVVTIGSAAGSIGGIGQAAYAATKSGLLGMMRSFAREVAPYNITVNVIAPGFVDSDALAPGLRTKFAQSVPLRRLGTAEEVAAMASYLCSSEAGYVTGQLFAIDGGLTAF